MKFSREFLTIFSQKTLHNYAWRKWLHQKILHFHRLYKCWNRLNSSRLMLLWSNIFLYSLFSILLFEIISNIFFCLFYCLFCDLDFFLLNFLLFFFCTKNLSFLSSLFYGWNLLFFFILIHCGIIITLIIIL